MEIDIGYSKGSLTFADMRRQFALLPSVLQADALSKAAVTGAKQIAAEAKHNIKPSNLPVPRRLDKTRVRRGRTRDLIRVARRRVRRGEAPAAIVHGIGAAYFLEHGNARVTATKPFSRAMDVTAPRLPAVYERAIRRQLKTIARQLKSGKLTKRVGRALADYAAVPLP